MKKLTILALAIFMFAGLAKAQLRYGVKVGANLTDIHTSNSIVDHVNMAKHYQLGLVMQYKLGILTFQPELLYSEKGGTLTDVYPASSFLSLPAGLSDANRDISLVTKNLEMPVNIQMGLKIGETRVFIQGGPYFALRLLGKINGENDVFKAVNTEFKFNSMECGFGTGAGVEYKNYQLSAKYDFGSTPLGKKKLNQITGVNVNPFYEMKNRNISLSLAYMF